MTSITSQLAAILKKVERPGDFVASGTIALATPALTVEGVGRIALPLQPAQAAALIALAERAPFGRGEKTLMDTSVRRTWQFEPDKVSLKGAKWQTMLDSIVAQVAAGLGVTGSVKAEFYKLLLYQTGDFFVGHRDTEKTPGMFATLVVVLPSDSSGGELVVRHLGREFRSDLNCEDPGEIAFAAFYADCVHEVLPVLSGCRLTLVYNLVRPKKSRPIRAPDYISEAEKIAGLLGPWAEAAPSSESAGPEKLVYPLAHAYTQAELCFANLKGADAGAASVLTAAAAAADCDIHLAQLVVEESGAAEYNDSGYGRRSRSNRPEFEVGEILDRSTTLSEWQRPDGSPVTLMPLPVIEDIELAPPESLEDLAPDEEEFSEATGNAGASFERTYRRAALVLWPKRRFLAILNQAGVAVTLPYLADLIGQWSSAKRAARESLAQDARQLATHMLTTWEEGEWSAGHYNKPARGHSFLVLLTEFGDSGLIETFWAKVMPGAAFEDSDVGVILKALAGFPHERAAHLLERAIAAEPIVDFGPRCALFAAAVKTRPDIAIAAGQALVAAMPGNPADPKMLDQWGRAKRFAMGFTADLLGALARLDSGLAEAAVKTMLAWPMVYDMDGVLIPTAMRLDAVADLRRAPVLAPLREACLTYLHAETRQKPEPPVDWARNSDIACKCVHCRDLSGFLVDPKRSTWMLRAAESDRSHVEQNIRRASVDLDTRTQTTGRPYTLICTKNQASYERAALRYQRYVEQCAALEA